jgi:hypothetical protein
VGEASGLDYRGWKPLPQGQPDSRAAPGPLLLSRELGLFTKPSIRMTFYEFIDLKSPGAITVIRNGNTAEDKLLAFPLSSRPGSRSLVIVQENSLRIDDRNRYAIM